MKRYPVYFLLLAPLLLISCSSKKENPHCTSGILDLTMSHYDEQPNKILNYVDSTSFTSITDSAALLRFEGTGRIGYFLKPSATDSSKREFTYNVKEGIVKTSAYQLDLIWVSDDAESGRNIYCWLTTYDNQRNQISRLDFAGWSKEKKRFVSGKIDCDTIIHMILNDRNEHRLFRINEKGNINFIATNKIDSLK